jgi:hypothetical protein
MAYYRLELMVILDGEFRIRFGQGIWIKKYRPHKKALFQVSEKNMKTCNLPRYTQIILVIS